MRRPMMYAASFFVLAILVIFHVGILDKLIFSCLDNSIEKNISITAKIITKEADYVSTIRSDKQVRTTLKVIIDTIDGKPIKNREKLLVKLYDQTDLKPGQYTKISGIVEIPTAKRNPGCFDYALYLRSIGIDYILDAEQICLYKKEKIRPLEKVSCSMQMKLYEFRENFLEDIKEVAGEDASGMIRAIMFGSKTNLDEEILEEFQKNGTAHVLAVSGLHVGLIYGFISALWVWKKGKLFFALIVIFFLAYVIMASFSPSVVRAVIMIWIHVFAVLTNRRYDMASAAFFTAILMLAHNPMHLFNTGFQMSFLAVLTLSLMLPIVKKIYSGVFLASIAIQAGLLPYTVYTFNYISLIAVVVNIPIIFITGVIVPVGMCSMAGIFIFEPLGEVMIKALSGLCIIMTKLNDMTAIDGVTVFNVVSPPLWMIALYYLVLLAFVSEDGRILFMRKKYGIIKKMMIGVMATSLIFGGLAGNHFKNTDIVFVDVGQGDCMHIRAGKRGDFLIDGGGSINYNIGKKTLKPYLLKNGTKSVDGAFITHMHTDHYKGVAELCREGMIERLYVYEGYKVREKELLEDTGLGAEQITYLYAGQKVHLNNEAYVEVLWPERHGFRQYEQMSSDQEDENQFSLILKVVLEGHTMLATGDVDSECLDFLAKKYGDTLDIDILKVAHHGSKYSDSEAFTETAKPEYAIFQVGKNNFGHPNEGIVEKFRRKGIMIYRNDLDGAVAFEFTPKGNTKVMTVIGE